jgi:uncharacterized protein (TIGR03067 family)
MPICCGLVSIALFLASLVGSGNKPNTGQDNKAYSGQENIEGSWRMCRLEFPAAMTPEERQALEFEVDGKTMPFSQERYVFKGDKVMFFWGRKAYGEGSFTLDTAVNPKTIDIKVTSADGTVKTAFGIYRIEKDTITLYYWNKRPTNFDGPADAALNRCVQMQLKRCDAGIID